MLDFAAAFLEISDATCGVLSTFFKLAKLRVQIFLKTTASEERDMFKLENTVFWFQLVKFSIQH